jgi:hypothetical protein
MRDILGKLTGENTDLVSFEEVAQRFRVRQRTEMGTQAVPVDKIVGSVGRYRDFTKEFLPRRSINKERWVGVETAMSGTEGWPPVDLYKIGDVYFVRDGNHRVSVARANGLTSLEAYVTEMTVPVDLTAADFVLDRWLIKAEYADFLAETGLDTLRPELDLTLTEPGRYGAILHHIQVHQYLRNQDLDREGVSDRLDWPNAVASWADRVYTPMIQAIHESGLLAEFPNRTEADLYLWINVHRDEIIQQFGLTDLSVDAAVSTFASTYSDRPLARTVKDLRLNLRRVFGEEGPIGLSKEEYLSLTERYVAFQQQTGLHYLRADAQVILTNEADYDALLQHIGVHQYLVNQELERMNNPDRLTWEQAVMSWHDTIYCPVVSQVRRLKLNKSFPNHTEADLYLMIARHREKLATKYKLAPLGPETAVVTFMQTNSEDLWGKTIKGLRLGLSRAIGLEKPLGMSQEEFVENRQRRAEGQRPLSAT